MRRFRMGEASWTIGRTTCVYFQAQDNGCPKPTCRNMKIYYYKTSLTQPIRPLLTFSIVQFIRIATKLSESSSFNHLIIKKIVLIMAIKLLLHVSQAHDHFFLFKAGFPNITLAKRIKMTQKGNSRSKKFVKVFTKLNIMLFYLLMVLSWEVGSTWVVILIEFDTTHPRHNQNGGNRYNTDFRILNNSIDIATRSILIDLNLWCMKSAKIFESIHS